MSDRRQIRRYTQEELQAGPFGIGNPANRVQYGANQSYESQYAANWDAVQQASRYQAQQSFGRQAQRSSGYAPACILDELPESAIRNAEQMRTKYYEPRLKEITAAKNRAKGMR